MGKIIIAICDDDEMIRKQIGNNTSSYLSNRMIDFEIYYYSNGTDLIEDINNISFSFVFLDIDLGKENGVEIAKYIRNNQTTLINIVFVTSYIEYQTKVLSIHTFDYLIKPLTNIKLNKVLDELLFWHNSELYNHKERIRFKTIDGIVTILVDNLIYFEYNNRRVDIVTKEHTYHMYEKIKNIAKIMEKYDFFSPHSAYVINMKEIDQYLKSENRLIMTNKKDIPISQLKAKQFRETYMLFIDKLWRQEL